MIIETEYEKKTLLSATEYLALEKLFLCSGAEKIVQMNYYFDTEKETLRKENTTCRIREINGVLRGTVKYHENKQNREENFAVDVLPVWFVRNNTLLIRKGSLMTLRYQWKLSDDILIALDSNSYLSETDYELEVEYPPNREKEACGVLALLALLAGNNGFTPNSLSKSERFFRKLNRENRKEGKNENVAC